MGEAWTDKFNRNAIRMERSFDRCGSHDPNNDVDNVFSYNRADPVEGTEQITTGYRKWADRYLSACNGQKNQQYQKRRMGKWNHRLQYLLSQGLSKGFVYLRD